MSSKHGQNITAERVEPSHFAMIPKMAIMDLDPYELALYCNYRQTVTEAEGGSCYKSNATLAKETKMSVSKLKHARQSLADKGYITITANKDPETQIINQPPTIKIADVWAENLKRYGKGGGSHKTMGGREKATPQAPESQGVGTTKHQRITIEEEPKEEESKPVAAKPADPMMRAFQKFPLVDAYNEAYKMAGKQAPLVNKRWPSVMEAEDSMTGASITPTQVKDYMLEKLKDGPGCAFTFLPQDIPLWLNKQADVKKQSKPKGVVLQLPETMTDDDWEDFNQKMREAQS